MLKLNSIQLKNFRLIESLVFDFPDQNLIVLTGRNGSGKTTFLNALAKLLTHIEGRLCSDQARSYDIQAYLEDSDIRHNSQKLDLQLNFGFLAKDIQLNISKEFGQKGFDQKIVPEDAFDSFNKGLKAGIKINLPVLCYYRIHRTYSFSSFTARPKNHLNDVAKKYQEGYQDALSPRISSFDSFVSWYSEIENFENQTIVETRNFENTNTQLDLVRESLSSFFTLMGISHLSELKIKREVGNTKSEHSLVIKYNDDFIPMKELSSGEKNLILLVADIARRISSLILDIDYPNQGIVLIDEIDLHLHPSWQRAILPALKNTFPSIKFIITTHSPQVLSSCSSNEIFQIVRGDNNLTEYRIKSFGEDSNSLLYKVFNTEDRSIEFSDLLKTFQEGIENNTSVEALREILNQVIALSNTDKGIGTISIIQDMQILLSSYEFDLDDKN